MEPILKLAARLLLFTLTAMTALAQSQSTTGAVQGTLVDEAGAVIAGATVEVKNLDNGSVKSLTSDDGGRFVFLQLQPGRYTLTASKQGYATVEQQNIALTVGQTVNLNLALKVSAVQERVTISAAPTIDTVKTESSTTLNETAISRTPVLGRKFEDLLTLTPGVSITQGPDGDEINFNGQRGIFNNISLDGGDYNNGFFAEQAGGQRAAIDVPIGAIKEFQVVATGANAEFGRAAGGFVNAITKSGTNQLHGDLFHFQRLEKLTSNTSDGKPLKDFHREQFGGSIGGPIIREKLFYFGTFEQIKGNLTRPNLSAAIGTPCSVQTPTIQANEALINGSADCQRLALLNFFKTTRGQDEGLAVKKPINTSAFLGKLDWKINPGNELGMSYNFNRSKKENETFDVPTYGNSANGTEGPGRINAFNLNLFTTLSATKVNEFHATYLREDRPRSATKSNIPADTAMGFATSFRFGAPFFLGPNVDELFQRFQLKDNFSVISGNHTVKFGGDWTLSNNAQVFRGFFQGRYIFDSVTGFLRYASPASLGAGFGPNIKGCSNGAYVAASAACPAGSTSTGGPLLLYLQGAGLSGPATDAAGASNIDNEEYALFIQDKWQAARGFTFNYGLRWEAQLFPAMLVPPAQTAYGRFLNDPRFPSDGTLHDDYKMFQPRVGFAWDIANNSKSVLRASWGIFNARQNMLTQVGSITTNGVQQQTIFLNSDIIASGVPGPVWPNVTSPTPVPAGQFPLFTGVRVFSKDYRNPRIYSTNVQFEQQIAPDTALYLDFTHSKGVYLTRFLNANQNGIFSPQLGEVAVTSALGKSLYRGFTAGVRKRYSKGFQLEANYVLSKDLDDDSNERDPFSFRYFDINNLQADYALSDRDIRHKFNFSMNGELRWGILGNARIQARSAQPITPGARTRTNRNTARKDNEYFSFDWSLSKRFRFGGERFAIVPTIEMFNTFNNKNLVNPLTTVALFNFDGFLRQGVGDPRQVQLSVRFTF
ncbi:MAG TPA: carboxypeptidase regulatory-like domain-containing protein [Blastocatellia bacterium]|nr:carboxypeptidase regulatory-like domain-containing protein [Blastocatellia bacterium]HMY72690.1 carboxypeptidase regulatory-like domain-containing protein [Blastocatellia bacterium]HNG31602.1 carboxypeptidase regulatory-like domain-containing protein [Blastocatellia bacterium]